VAVLRIAATLAIQRMAEYLAGSDIGEWRKDVCAVDLAYYLDDLGREEERVMKEGGNQQIVDNRFIPPQESFVL